MGFLSILGRILFASTFILSFLQLFKQADDDGGPAAKELVPKFAAANKHLSSIFGVEILDFHPKYFVCFDLCVKVIGGTLFIFNDICGVAYLLLNLLVTSPILYDFYNYSRDDPEYVILLNEFFQRVALFGALLYFIGMRSQILNRPPKPWEF